jgi:hypothetical protein
MKKNEIIKKTMSDSRLFQTEYEPPFSDDPDFEEIVIGVLEASLQRVGSNQEIKTREDFKHLNVDCCDTCHTFYAHYEMAPFDLADGGTAWLCARWREPSSDKRRISQEPFNAASTSRSDQPTRTGGRHFLAVALKADS